ncbi:MAG: HEAT repeat domain-containing protein, partial [Actinobacteria bacterium]|nr:HEAT repeat domain-containing protein [Actinomycetota bacterium]
MEEEEQEQQKEQLEDSYKREAVQFIVNAHATLVNMRLYPLSSSMVTSTLDKAWEYLEQILTVGKSFTIGSLENVILINEHRLDDIEQQKVPLKAFAAWMNEHGFTSIEFMPGITHAELRDLYELMVSSEDDIELRQNFDEVLEERGIEHAALNQRVYVSFDSAEEIGEPGGGGPGTPLDALKDELLIRYLMGTVDLDGIEDVQVMDVLSDSGKVGGMMSAFLSMEGADEGILIKSKKAEDALQALSDMVDRVEDENLRQELSGQVSNVIAEMSPDAMTSMLTSNPPANLDIHNLRKDVVAILGDQKLLELIDALVGDYINMKEESGDLDVEWVRQKLVNFNQLFMEVRSGETGEKLSDKIDKMLEEAGIQEEREPETGKKVLSAYQLLGTPLEEEMLELTEGVDRTVSRQIYQLYTMGENDLAEGLLRKITDNLTNESAKVRRFATELLKDTLDGLDPEFGVIAGDLIEPILLERVNVESDYTAFTLGVDTLAIIAEHSLRKGQVGKASEIVELLSVLDSPEQGKGSELLKHLAAVLSNMKGPDGIISIHNVLLEEDQEKRDNIIIELANIGPGALSPLVDIVKDRGQIELQPRALEAFQVAGPAGVTALMDVLDRENPWYIYRNVLNAIADLGLEESVGRVGEMVNHSDERVRREAIRTLARLGDRDSLNTIRNAINDPSPAVRQIAVRVLGVFNDKRVAPFLIELLNDEGPRGKNEDKGVIEAACLALGDLRDSEYIPNLIEVLSKGGLFRRAKPDEVRAAACIALGNIGDGIAEPILEKASNDSSIMVSSCARKALKKLKGVVIKPEPATGEEISVAADQAPSEQAAAALRGKMVEEEAMEIMAVEKAEQMLKSSPEAPPGEKVEEA